MVIQKSQNILEMRSILRQESQPLIDPEPVEGQQLTKTAPKASFEAVSVNDSMKTALFSVSYAGMWGQHSLDIEAFVKKATDDTAYSDDWTKCVKAIQEASVVAENYGVYLGLQNHHDTAISTDAYIEFLNDVDHPNCKAMYDPWVPALLGEDLYAAAKTLAPRMAQTTLADYVRLKRWAYQPGLVNYRKMADMVRAVPVGKGFLPLEPFFNGLKEGGFNGHVAYEMCSPLRGGGSEENLDKCALESLNRIKELIH